MKPGKKGEIIKCRTKPASRPSSGDTDLFYRSQSRNSVPLPGNSFVHKNPEIIETHPSIYLVEDDIDDQELLEEALQAIRPDLRLNCFSSGQKFLEALSQTADEHLPRLIILDYNIPEMNGAEILEQLRLHTRYNNLVKVVWSTSNNERFQTSSFEAGATAYLIKPSSITGIRQLAETLAGYVGNAAG